MKKMAFAAFALSVAILLGNSRAGFGQRKLAFPMISHAEVPLYPPLARAANLEGMVRVEVATDGHQVVSTLVKEGKGLLAESAEQNVKSWKFATHEPTTFTVVFRYKLVDDINPIQNNPRVILKPPTEVEIDALRWPPGY